MTSPIPLWLILLIAAVVYGVMFSLGLMIGREQIAAAVQRRGVLAFALFAVLVPVPAAAVLAVRLFDLTGVVAAGILLMAISPGAPVALRRALEAGGGAPFAPALHLAILVLAVLSVPLSLATLSAMYGKSFAVSPLDVARQVFVMQLLPLGHRQRSINALHDQRMSEQIMITVGPQQTLPDQRRTAVAIGLQYIIQRRRGKPLAEHTGCPGGTLIRRRQLLQTQLNQPLQRFR